MDITGTVLLNARGVNINGYDCFVNLSPDCKYYSWTTWGSQWTGETPISGFPSLIGVSNLCNKYSTCSFMFSNYGSVGIATSVTNRTLPTTYTLSFWRKNLILDESQAQNTLVRSYHYRGISINCLSNSCYIMYNSRAHKVEGNILNGEVTQDHNVNFANDNWHHFAAVRNGTTYKLFVDGTMVFNQSRNDWKTSGFGLGTQSLVSTAYIDDIVVIMDQALWSSSFTPPSTYLLDSKNTMSLDQVQRNNIIAANVDKKLIIPDIGQLKVY